MSVTIIAEAGLNWESIDDAMALTYSAKECGADIIKFQTHFDWEYPMMEKQDWKFLKEYCDEIGIIFMSTAWSFEAIDFLADIGMTHWKIPSSEVTNKKYMEKIKSKNPLVVFASNGFGNKPLYYDVIEELYCISKYPHTISEISFHECEIYGYSDHTDNIYAPIIAASHGSQVIEKHFCLSHPCIDDAVSITPDEFKEMVGVIRQLENYKEPVIPPEILALKNRVTE